MNFERKKPLSDFGIAVKLELMKRNKSQNWLIGEICKINPTMCVDSSVLHRILTGQIRTGKVVEAIKTILNLED
ncbi:MAG: hypothetical protein IJZ65_10160 [Ruminiclostridium sp.]|nr:hypothetical protein [Ruminiclostridium sp.]MBQ8931994.1 hypothetical protein [Ruminiclostridium sp.]